MLQLNICVNNRLPCYLCGKKIALKANYHRILLVLGISVNDG